MLPGGSLSDLIVFRIYIVFGWEEEHYLENMRILSWFVWLKIVLFNILCF